MSNNNDIIQNVNIPGGTYTESPGGAFSDEGAARVFGQDALRGEKGEKGDTGATGPAGPQGPQGPQGPMGNAGTAATIALATPSTVDTEVAFVRNLGDSTNAMFQFGALRGHQGNYYVKLWQDAATEPAGPTGVWMPPAAGSGNSRGTYNGTDGWLVEVPSTVTHELWEVEGVFDPATDTSLEPAEFSGVFQAGARGPAGPAGPAGPLRQIDTDVTVTTGAPGTNASASVTINTDSEAQFSFTIPRGATGATGPTQAFAIQNNGVKDTDTNAARVTLIRNADTEYFSFALPRGATGNTGPTGPIRQIDTDVTINTLASGAPATASATINADSEVAFTFGIPAGPQGATGNTGPTRQIDTDVTVTTLATGSAATASAAINADSEIAFTFGIPRGATGATGPAGAAGTQVSATTAAATDACLPGITIAGTTYRICGGSTPAAHFSVSASKSDTEAGYTGTVQVVYTITSTDTNATLQDVSAVSILQNGQAATNVTHTMAHTDSEATLTITIANGQMGNVVTSFTANATVSGANEHQNFSEQFVINPMHTNTIWYTQWTALTATPPTTFSPTGTGVTNQGNFVDNDLFTIPFPQNDTESNAYLWVPDTDIDITNPAGSFHAQITHPNPAVTTTVNSTTYYRLGLGTGGPGDTQLRLHRGGA